jgi:hypothetical protein
MIGFAEFRRADVNSDTQLSKMEFTRFLRGLNLNMRPDQIDK